MMDSSIWGGNLLHVCHSLNSLARMSTLIDMLIDMEFGLKGIIDLKKRIGIHQDYIANNHILHSSPKATAYTLGRALNSNTCISCYVNLIIAGEKSALYIEQYLSSSNYHQGFELHLNLNGKTDPLAYNSADAMLIAGFSAYLDKASYVDKRIQALIMHARSWLMNSSLAGPLLNIASLLTSTLRLCLILGSESICTKIERPPIGSRLVVIGTVDDT
jgi:hypothetical protein